MVGSPTFLFLLGNVERGVGDVVRKYPKRGQVRVWHDRGGNINHAKIVKINRFSVRELGKIVEQCVTEILLSQLRGLQTEIKSFNEEKLVKR